MYTPTFDLMVCIRLALDPYSLGWVGSGCWVEYTRMDSDWHLTLIVWVGLVRVVGLNVHVCIRLTLAPIRFFIYFFFGPKVVELDLSALS